MLKIKTTVHLDERNQNSTTFGSHKWKQRVLSALLCLSHGLVSTVWDANIWEKKNKKTFSRDSKTFPESLMQCCHLSRTRHRQTSCYAIFSHGAWLRHSLGRATWLPVSFIDTHFTKGSGGANMLVACLGILANARIFKTKNKNEIELQI